MYRTSGRKSQLSIEVFLALVIYKGHYLSEFEKQQINMPRYLKITIKKILHLSAIPMVQQLIFMEITDFEINSKQYLPNYK